MLLVYAGLVPAVVLALWAMTFKPGVHKVHVTYLGLVTRYGRHRIALNQWSYANRAHSIFITIFLTDVRCSKLPLSGIHAHSVKDDQKRSGKTETRPHSPMQARMPAPPKDPVHLPGTLLNLARKQAQDAPTHTLVTFEICTETSHHLLHDGWRSFPSGHSSFSFAGLGYIAVFLTGQLRIMHPHTSLSNVLLCLCPLLGAALIAISRCEDYRHDVWDVCAGSALGLLVALFTYRRYYPNLRSKACDEPFPSMGDLAGMGKAKDSDEETRIGVVEDSDGEVERGLLQS